MASRPGAISFSKRIGKGVRSIESSTNRIHVGGDFSPRFAAADHKHSRDVGEPLYRPAHLLTYLATEWDRS